MLNEQVHSSAKLIADALIHIFVTLVQTNLTPIGPSTITHADIRNNHLPRQVNSTCLSPSTPEEILTLITD